MKNQIVNQLNDVIKQHGEKLHNILDAVVYNVNAKVNAAEGSHNDMLFNPNTCVFEVNTENYRIVILRDFVTMAVTTRIVIGDDVVAECSLNVVDSFNERYLTRLDKKVKNNIAEIFTEIENIDTNNINTEEVAPEQQETAEMPAEDVEVIEPKN